MRVDNNYWSGLGINHAADFSLAGGYPNEEELMRTLASG